MIPPTLSSDSHFGNVYIYILHYPTDTVLLLWLIYETTSHSTLDYNSIIWSIISFFIGSVSLIIRIVDHNCVLAHRISIWMKIGYSILITMLMEVLPSSFDGPVECYIVHEQLERQQATRSALWNLIIFWQRRQLVFDS
jgi:hypothetical protein